MLLRRLFCITHQQDHNETERRLFLETKVRTRTTCKNGNSGEKKNSTLSQTLHDHVPGINYGTENLILVAVVRVPMQLFGVSEDANARNSLSYADSERARQATTELVIIKMLRFPVCFNQFSPHRFFRRKGKFQQNDPRKITWRTDAISRIEI